MTNREETNRAQQTLIPLNIVDHASQRLFVVSLFVAVQCWKIYDILLVKADQFAIASDAAGLVAPQFTSLNNFTFVLKYALIDGACLLMLPVLNIPLLTFLPGFTFLLTIAFNTGNFLLTSQSAIPLLSGVFVPFWNAIYKEKELTIAGDSVPVQAAIDMNDHFRGRYTIQYLPESSVTLNPFDFGPVCLEPPSSSSDLFPKSFRLPMEFNTTTQLESLQLQHIRPDNSMALLNYTRNDIRRLLKRDKSYLSDFPNYKASDQRIFYLDVDIKEPGLYRIKSVLDVDGMTIPVQKSSFTIGHCPQAEFAYPGSEAAYTHHQCLGKPQKDHSWTLPMISTLGVAPLNIELAIIHNGETISKFNSTITSETTKGMLWLQSRKVTRNLLEQEILLAPERLHFASLGKLEFQLTAVSDAVGITRRFNTMSKHKDVHHEVQLKDLPELSLRVENPEKKLLFNSYKTLHVDTRKTVEFPLQVTVLFEGEESEIRNYTFANREDLKKGITVLEPGIYTLLSGTDKFCPCKISEAFTTLTIVRPLSPTATISHTPILDKCVGSIGFDFDIAFTGDGPFEIRYEIFKNSSGVLRPVLNHRGLREYKQSTLTDGLKFAYKPTREGTYTVRFKSLRDANYDSIPIVGNNEFSTYLHKRSSFSFFKDSQQSHKLIKLCKDVSTEVPVYFDGNFPFKFSYTISEQKSGKVVRSNEVNSLYEDTYIIEVPKFDKGGHYVLTLGETTDKLGCSAESQKKEQIHFQARGDIPLIQFKSPQVHSIVEGDSVRVPLSVDSAIGVTGADRIEYLWSHINDPSKTRKLSSSGVSGLSLKEEGVYKLLSFVNGGCPGEVKLKDSTIRVEYLSRPQLQLSSHTERLNALRLSPVCQNEPQEIKIDLKGQRPFVLEYDIRCPSGKVKSSFMKVDDHGLSITLPSNRAGVYKHTFTAIYDAHYTKEKSSRLINTNTNAFVEYNVMPLPNLEVKKPYLQICESKVTEDSVSLSLNLEGEAPFEVHGTVIDVVSNRAEPFTISGLTDSHVKLGQLQVKSSWKNLFKVGEHIIKFETIVDSNKCTRTAITGDNKVMLSVTEVPTIVKQDPHKEYLCVGDHVFYDVSGIAPFNVFYNFNGQSQKAETGHRFSRLASRPGTLEIVALQDLSANLCLVNLTSDAFKFEELKLVVHDLPSVEISQGDNIIKNMHIGDQSELVFRLTGTAPFTITYVRTVEEDAKGMKSKAKPRRKVVETKTIRDIWDYEYSEIVSLEGTYEAIEVSDAYCRASRDVLEVL